MSTSLKYKYRTFGTEPSEAFPRRFGVFRPVIPVWLVNGNEKFGYLALVDSGADFCVFHASIGDVIGIKVESGKKQSFSGISSQTQQLIAYFHNIKIEVAGYAHECWVGFSRDIKDQAYGILGQEGFFSNYNVNLDYENKQIELRLKDPT